MKALRTPLGVWDWRGTGLVLVLLLAPLLATLTLVPGSDVLSTATSARSLLVGTATLAAGVFLYLHWRISASDTSGWLALVLAVAAVPQLALGAFSLTHPDEVARQDTWLFAFRVAITLGLIATVTLSRRARFRSDPLAAGLLVGLSIASVRHLVLVAAPSLPPLPAPELLTVATLAVLTAVLALTMSRLTELPSWIRLRVAVALLLIGLGSAVGGTVSLGTGLIGAVLLAGTAASVLHLAIDNEKQQLVDLSERLHAVEVGLRQDQARLHEIDATVAGIASAQRLMHDGVGADRSDALAAMMRAEVERLQRLMGDRVPTRRRSVDLDDVVGQIVLAHRVRGRVVAWEPSGLRALGRADDIAEIVNVLLENAAVHGGPDRIAVSVAEDFESRGITVSVTDHGPGVAPELRGQLFDWGVHRPGSPGQGIGLHVAAEVAEQLGGRLELVPRIDGASFALHLPAAPWEVVASGSVARAS
jgi:signal transduction histidine kinase